MEALNQASEEKLRRSTVYIQTPFTLVLRIWEISSQKEKFYLSIRCIYNFLLSLKENFKIKNPTLPLCRIFLMYFSIQATLYAKSLTSKHMHNLADVPGTLLSTLHKSTPFTFTITL